MTAPLDPADPQAAIEPPIEAQSMRRLGRDTLVYLTGTILARLVSFVMLPVYTRYLTPTDYGILQMLDLAVDIASILISAGATAGIMRFYFKAKTEEERKTILATAFLLQIGLNGIGTLLLVAAAPLIQHHVLGGEGTLTMVRIAAFNFTLGVLTSVPLFLFQARQQSGRFITVNLVRLVMQLGLNILFVVALRWGPLGVLTSGLLTHIVLGLTLGGLLLRHTGIRFSLPVVRDFRRYGVPYQFTKAATFILTFGDRFFLQHYHNLAVVGVYGIAYMFGFLLVGNVGAPFLRAWGPQRHMLIHAPKPVRDAHYNRGFLYGNLMLVTAATIMGLFIRPVLGIMVTEAFRSAANLVPIILAAYLFQAWKSIVEFGIQVSERTKYVTYAAWISMVVVLILYWVLIPPLGGLGAALSTLVAMAVRFGLQLHWSQKLWPIAYDWRPHRRLVACGGAAVGLAFAIAPSGLVAQFALSTVLAAGYAGLVWWLVLGPDDRRVVLEIVRSPRSMRRLFSTP